MPRPRKLVINKYLSDQEVGELQGKWIDETYIKHPIINYNCDVYYIDDNKEEKLLLKFRKNSIKNNLIRKGWHSYKDLAKPSRGRGASAGPIDTDSIYWKKRNIINTSKWSTGYLNPKGNKIKEDISNIPALQPELRDAASYYSSLVNGGIMTVNEAREALAYEPLDGQDDIRAPANIAGSAVNPDLGGRPESEETPEDA